MKKFLLEIVVFMCGAIVMAYEIIGSRMLGPYVGTSMIVWSSIIGIILLSLSLGYYYGGRIADKSPNYHRLAIIIGLAGLFILFSILIKDLLLEFLTGVITDVRIVSIISSLILFSLPAILLGMVSPFAARLKIKETKTAGATVGYLYAISTFGSITGTFLAGFYLIPGFRITSILIILAGVLLTCAGLLYLIYRNEELYLTSKISSNNEN